MILGHHSLVGGLILLLATVFVCTTVAEANGTIVAGRVNDAIGARTLKSRLMRRFIVKRDTSTDKKGYRDDKKAKEQPKKDAKKNKDEKKEQEQNAGAVLRAAVYVVLVMGTVPLLIPHV